MYRLYEKRDNQPVSMIYDHPKMESFTSFREMIRKSMREKYLSSKKTRNIKGSKYSTSSLSLSNQGMKRPKSLIGASTMGSPKKKSLEELNSFNDEMNIKMNDPHDEFLKKLSNFKPIVLKIKSLEINSKKLDVDKVDESRNSFKIHFKKKKFVIEYEVVDDQEEMRDEDQPDIMDQVRLEVFFKDISDMDIFSGKNEIQFDSNKYYIKKLHRENYKDFPEWIPCSLNVLLPENEEEDDDDDEDVESESQDESKGGISLEIILERDSYGRSLCGKKETLSRMMAAGLSFSVDGRRPQSEITGNMNLNLGQKFLPSSQNSSNFFLLIFLVVRRKEQSPSFINKKGFEHTGLKQIIDKNEQKDLKKFEEVLSKK